MSTTEQGVPKAFYGDTPPLRFGAESDASPAATISRLFLTDKHTSTIHMGLADTGNLGSIATVLRGPVLNSLWGTLKTDLYGNRFPIAALLSYVPDVPDEILDSIHSRRVDTGLTLTNSPAPLAGQKPWFLCDYAEEIMVDALAWQSVITINDALSVKLTGKLVGICTETFTTDTGATFVEGNWYAPYDFQTQRVIRDTFDQGIPFVALDTGEWKLLRGVDHSYPELKKDLAKYKTETTALPDTIAGMERQQFRSESFESF